MLEVSYGFYIRVTDAGAMNLYVRCENDIFQEENGW